MGEVYRARDTRLGRDVAVEVLRGPFATDPDRLRDDPRVDALLRRIGVADAATSAVGKRGQ